MAEQLSICAQDRRDFMESLDRHIRGALEGMQLNDEQLAVISSDIIHSLIEEFPGQQIYVPKEYKHLDSLDRCMAIYNECRGRNHAIVAKKYGCTARTVYRIYNRIREAKAIEARIPLDQPDIFGNAE